MATIGIIGHGFVGKATHYGFRGPGNSIMCYDKFKKDDVINNIPESMYPLKEVVDKSQFIFICLPTPFSEKREKIDLAIIDEVLAEITKWTDNTNKIVIIKSTVVPGTTSTYAKKYPKTHFCFNPEFLTEANYLEDFVNADRIVVGADNDQVRLKVTDLYKDRFPKTPVYHTDSTTAEMVKYMANCFLSTKVMFANQIYDLCQKLGIKYEEVKKMVVADHRIRDSHLDVTTERGFGGKCFPKDLVALIGLGRELKVDVSFLEKVWTENLRLRKHHDWDEIPFAKTD